MGCVCVFGILATDLGRGKSPNLDQVPEETQPQSRAGKPLDMSVLGSVGLTEQASCEQHAPATRRVLPSPLACEVGTIAPLPSET